MKLFKAIKNLRSEKNDLYTFTNGNFYNVQKRKC